MFHHHSNNTTERTNEHKYFYKDKMWLIYFRININFNTSKQSICHRFIKRSEQQQQKIKFFFISFFYTLMVLNALKVAAWMETTTTTRISKERRKKWWKIFMYLFAFTMINNYSLIKDYTMGCLMLTLLFMNIVL